MITINQLEQTGYACPSQWDGTTTNGEYVYIRFRHGRLTVEVNEELEFIAYPFDDDWSGIISQNEMIDFINNNAQNLMIDL